MNIHVSRILPLLSEPLSLPRFFFVVVVFFFVFFLVVTFPATAALHVNMNTTARGRVRVS